MKHARRLMPLALAGILVAIVSTAVMASAEPEDLITYISSSSSGVVDGIEFKDEDILAYNGRTDTWAMHFDGSDLGLNGFDIDAVHVVGDSDPLTLDPILFSLKNGRSFGSFHADDSDIVQFTPTSLGDDTDGSFALFFDGSNHGLTTTGEDVDAIAMTQDGRLVVSTGANFKVPKAGGGNLAGRGQDLIVQETSGSWSVVFDGSDVSLSNSTENIWGSWIDNRTGELFLTTKDEYSVPGSPVNPLVGDQEEIVLFAGTTGLSTTGTFSLFWNGDDYGIAGERLDGFSSEYINRPPVAEDDLFTMLEDGVLNGNVLANNGNGADSDPDGDPLTVNPTPVSSPSNGTLTLAASGDFTYTPFGDYFGFDSFEYELDDGFDTDVGLVTITVVAVNDAPSFVKGADESVLEDAGAQSVAGWATAISAGPANESSQILTFDVSNDNSGLFATQPAVDATTGTLTYTPADDANGVATVDVTLMDDGGTANGGVDTSSTQQFTITVVAVNDAPSFVKGADESVLEDAGAQSVAGWATAISPGPVDEAGQTVTFNIAGNTNAGLFSAGPAVDASGTLTYTSAADANGTATITLELMDDGGTANGGVDTSTSQTFEISVTAVNDAPSFVKGADESVLEDAGAQSVAGWATAISAGPANESSQILTFDVSNDNSGLFATQPAVDATTGTLTYTPADDANGVATVDVTLMDDGGTANGGVDTSSTQQFTITVVAVNDAPSFVKGADESVLEDAGAQSVAGWATAISPGPVDEAGQTVTFNIAGNTNAGLFSAGPAVDASGTLTYTSAADANGTATITLELMDDGGTANGGVDTSPTQSFTITVTAVNDVPSFVKGADESVLFNSGPQTVAGWATAISPGPADEVGQTLTFNITGNTDPTLFTVQPAVDATGTLTYTPDPATSGGTATITLELMDNGGTANGGVDTSSSQSFDITVTVNPVLSFDKKINGQDADNPNTPIPPVVGPGDVVTFSFEVDSLGGADAPAADISISDDVLGDIVLSGVPEPGVSGPSGDDGDSVLEPGETWTYSSAATAPGLPLTASVPGRCDLSQSPNAMPVHKNVATLTIPSSTQPDPAHLCVVLAPTAVDDTVAAASSPGDDWHTPLDTTLTVTNGSSEDLDGNDTLGSPAATIATFGGGSLGGAVTDNVAGTTVGVGAGSVSVNADGSFTFTPDTGFTGLLTFEYRLSNFFGTSDATVTLAVGERPETTTDNLDAIGNVGLDTSTGGTFSVLDNDAGDSIAITAMDSSSANGAAVSHLGGGQFIYDPAPGFNGSDSFGYTIANGFGSASGTVSLTVTDVIWFVDNTAAAGGDGRLSTPFNALTGPGSFAAVAGDQAGDAVFLYTGVGTYAGGLTLLDNQFLVGQGSSASLASILGISVPPYSPALPSTGGTNPVIAGPAGGVSLGSGNTIRGLDIGTTGGTALGGAAVGALSVSEVDTLTAARGLALDLAGGTAAMSVDVGAVTVTGSSVGGVSLDSNVGSTTTLGSVSLSTTGGIGLSASNAGTLTINGTTNSVSSTGDAAVSIIGTTIGGTGMTFQSVSSIGGASNGIVLDSTGTAGFTVAGVGTTTSSGGTIATKTGSDGSTTTGIGIRLNQTGNVTLDNMQLNDFENFAIRGTNVSNVSLTGTVVSGTNGTSAGEDEGSVSFNALTGAAAFDDVAISGGLEDNIVITNSGGTLDMDVTNSTIGLNSTTLGNDGILVETSGSSVLDILVEDTVFAGARGDMIQVNALGTSNQTIVIRDNTFNNAHPNIVSGGGGITISGGSVSSNITVDYTIEGTTPGDQVLSGAEGNAITVNYVNGGGSATGTIKNNAIGVSANGGSGSAGGSGIAVGTQKDVDHVVLVDGNTILGVNGFAGLDLSADGTSTMDATVTNNTFDQFGGFALAGVYALLNGSGAGTADICANVSANTITNTVPFGFAILLDELNPGTWNIPGFGGTSGGVALDSFLSAQNTIGAGLVDTLLASNVSGSGCSTP